MNLSTKPHISFDFFAFFAVFLVAAMQVAILIICLLKKCSVTCAELFAFQFEA